MKPIIKKIINRSVFFMLLSFISTSGFAQFPDLISYQTIIRNSNNELVANTSIGVLISILSGSEADLLWYQEEHTVKTNINGLAYIIIGKGSIHNGTMSGIDWSKGPFFIKSETDPNGGNNYTLVVISQMLSVPYAIFAKSAENVTGQINELDPQFNASISKGIHAVDTAAWNRKLNSYTETDPLFYGSISRGITAADTAYWNKNQSSYIETDPLFNASISSGITAVDTATWNHNLSSYTETIALINASIAGGIINSADTAAWNNFLRSNIEKDPLFYASISSGITAADTAAWNKNQSSYIETEPLFNASISSGITAVDTATWNHNLSSYTETDPLFYASISSGITAVDTAAWNQILYLSDNIIFTSGKSIKLNISDTFTMLSNYRIGIANKLNISDTASMLRNYRNVNASKLNISDTTIILTNLRANISSKLNISDTATMLRNYRNVNASKLNISDTTIMLTNVRANISSKLNISDTATMLSNYRTANASKLNISDTTIMLTNVRTNISSKLNISDTASMLTNYRTAISSKLNISDTATMLRNYRNVNASKLNISDTTIMLTNLRAANASKLNISDTLNMLFPYLRKADLIITDLQNQVAQLSLQLSLPPNVIVDIDGNNYDFVKIGNQYWMADNLRVSRYKNGDSIPIIESISDWSSLLAGARCWYNNDSITYEHHYGNLYNWYAATDPRGICPAGWHVPTDTEWTTLTNHLGGEPVAGAKLKSNGLEYWNTPNTSATDERDFSALPAGYRDNTGSFLGLRNDALFWSSSYYDSNDAWTRSPYISSAQMYRYNKSKKFGVSIRCLRD